MKPGFQRVRTRWNRGFMALHQALPVWTVILVVPVRPESGFRRVTPSRGPSAKWHCVLDRDINAARNLLDLAASGAERLTACGGMARPGKTGRVPMNQE